MKIFTRKEIQEADAYTIRNEPINSLALMERASKQVAKWILNKYSKKYSFYFLIGKGNNGGDGLAIARMLSQYGYQCNYFIALGESGTNDFEANLADLRKLSDVKEVKTFKEFIKLSAKEDNIVWVDAVLGSGLTRVLGGDLANRMMAVNEAKGVKLAIDIPSGLFADKATEGVTFKAHYTLSFQFPKLAFMAPENFSFVGEWRILPIGINSNYIASTPSSYHLTDVEDLVFPALSPFAHKGDRGRVAIIAGRYGQMGAAIMATKAALRAGAGLLSIQTCHHCVGLVQSAISEALIIEDVHEYALGSYDGYIKQDVLAFGPAVGFAHETRQLFKQLLINYQGQLILDADAISMLAEDKSLLALLPKGTILTPHIGEFDRLVGKQTNHFDRLQQLKLFAMEYHCVVLLKGKYSAIANVNGDLYFNPTGNNGMAKGGSGDVLTGIIAGLYPQLKDNFKTLQTATYLHGASADLLKEIKSLDSYSPTDLIENLHLAQKKLVTRQ